MKAQKSGLPLLESPTCLVQSRVRALIVVWLQYLFRLLTSSYSVVRFTINNSCLVRLSWDLIDYILLEQTKAQSNLFSIEIVTYNFHQEYHDLIY